MGYKILDVKADIHEDVGRYFDTRLVNRDGFSYAKMEQVKAEVLDIVDEHFEKIER